MKRVFFALPLGGALGGTLLDLTRAALGGEQGTRGRFRLPRAAGLHLTLLFLGDVEEARLARLWASVTDALPHVVRPQLVLEHADSFPQRGRERVLWMGVRETQAAGHLERLFRGVLDGARAAGFDTSAEEGRPFRPHITVARPTRSRPRGPVPDAFYRLAPELPWSPEHLALVESTRALEGPPIYVSLERLQLPL